MPEARAATPLYFGDTFAWGGQTLGAWSPDSSVFDPAVPPAQTDEEWFASYAKLTTADSNSKRANCPAKRERKLNSGTAQPCWMQHASNPWGSTLEGWAAIPWTY